MKITSNHNFKSKIILLKKLSPQEALFKKILKQQQLRKNQINEKIKQFTNKEQDRKFLFVTQNIKKFDNSLKSILNQEEPKRFFQKNVEIIQNRSQSEDQITQCQKDRQESNKLEKINQDENIYYKNVDLNEKKLNIITNKIQQSNSLDNINKKISLKIPIKQQISYQQIRLKKHVNKSKELKNNDGLQFQQQKNKLKISKHYKQENDKAQKFNRIQNKKMANKSLHQIYQAQKLQENTQTNDGINQKIIKKLILYCEKSIQNKKSCQYSLQKKPVSLLNLDDKKSKKEFLNKFKIQEKDEINKKFKINRSYQKIPQIKKEKEFEKIRKETKQSQSFKQNTACTDESSSDQLNSTLQKYTVDQNYYNENKITKKSYEHKYQMQNDNSIENIYYNNERILNMDVSQFNQEESFVLSESDQSIQSKKS